jgi:hypothetical protein
MIFCLFAPTREIKSAGPVPGNPRPQRSKLAVIHRRRFQPPRAAIFD